MMSLITIVAVIVMKNNIVSGARNDSSISWFLKYTPIFDLTKIPQISVKCQRDFQTFLTAIDDLELWALKSEKIKTFEFFF